MLLWLSVTLGAACGNDDACRVLCEKDDACLGGTDVDGCIASCESQAEDDPAYADAVAERADCVADLACDEIQSECRPSGE